MPDNNVTFTPHLHLSKMPANYRVWAQLMNDNLTSLDAAVSGFILIQNLRGGWTNSTAYAAGDSVVDTSTALIWRCAVTNISSTIPTTFAQERVAFPAYWVQYSTVGAGKGTWTGPGTSYVFNDFVSYQGRYAVCILPHTSTASFDADAASGYWNILIDVSAYLPLIGGTLTGPLIGTTATFSGAVTGPEHTAPAATNLFLNAPTGNQILLRNNSANIVGLTATQLYPSTTNTINLGTSTNRWSGVYGVVGDFSGALTGTTATFSGSELVGYGTAVPSSVYFGTSNATPSIQAAGTTLTTIAAHRYTGGSNGPIFNLSMSKSTVVGTQTIVAANDILGALSWNGSDGVKFVEGAYIRAEVDGTPGLDDMPTRLVFSVSPDGTATAAEAMRISNTKAVTLAGALTGTTATFTTTTAANSETTNTGVNGANIKLTGNGAVTPIKWLRCANGQFDILNNGYSGSILSITDAGIATFANTVFAPGAQIQTVFTETGAVATGTTAIPFDNTIPQITEGDQYMTCVITPKSATSRLIIDVTINLATSAAGVVGMIAALFQDATANALATAINTSPAPGNPCLITFRHVMTSGTTSATTFRVRAGVGGAGTTTFNGVGGGAFFGGTLASSIVITETA